MPKKRILILALASIFIILIIWTTFFQNSKKLQETGQLVNIDLTTIELADEPKEYSQGLMNRDFLCEKCGMLFTFNTEQTRSFWMKNTLIPLDIIFVDGSGIIQKIHSNTKINQTKETYSSVRPIKYVLEINSGYSRNQDINEGDKLDIDSMIKKSIDYQY